MHTRIKRQLWIRDQPRHFDITHLELLPWCEKLQKHLSVNLKPVKNKQFYPADTGYISFIPDVLLYSMLVRVLAVDQIGNLYRGRSIQQTIEHRMRVIENLLKVAVFFPVLSKFKSEDEIYEYAKQQQAAIQRKYSSGQVIGSNFIFMSSSALHFRFYCLVGQFGNNKRIIDYFKVYTTNQQFMIHDPDVFSVQYRFRKDPTVQFVRVTHVPTGVSIVFSPQTYFEQLPKSWVKSQMVNAIKWHQQLEANYSNIYTPYLSQCDYCVMRGFCANPLMYLKERVEKHGKNQ